MRKRPTLKVGDVCKLSKSYYRKHYRARYKPDTSIVVLSFRGDSSDGRTSITVAVAKRKTFGGKYDRPIKTELKRRYLWCTGYNINNSKDKPIALKESINRIKESFKTTKTTTKGPHLCNCDWGLVQLQGCGCNGL